MCQVVWDGGSIIVIYSLRPQKIDKFYHFGHLPKLNYFHHIFPFSLLLYQLHLFYFTNYAIKTVSFTTLSIFFLSEEVIFFSYKTLLYKIKVIVNFVKLSYEFTVFVLVLSLVLHEIFTSTVKGSM